MRIQAGATLVALALIFLTPSFAQAKNPEDVFGGKILLSTKSFPTQAKSVNAYIATLKKQATDKFWEHKETKEWKVYYTAFFKRPLDDLEVTMKTYDISDGTKRMVESYELYLDSRGQRAISGSLRLKKGDDNGQYSPNAKILMVMENRGKIVSQTTFFIQGEGKHFSGKVTFTEEETHEKDSGK